MIRKPSVLSIGYVTHDKSRSDTIVWLERCARCEYWPNARLVVKGY